MARRPRVFFERQTLHLIQRGNNRNACFGSDRDRVVYLSMLAEIAAETPAALHAYVLMTNHVHLLLTVESANGASKLMQRLGVRYTAFFNRAYGRSGSLWDGRFRAVNMASDAQVLACYRYIEENPVRAGMVESPADYHWTSHRANIGVETRVGLRPHGAYLALASDSSMRMHVYRELFGRPLDPETLEAFRLGTGGQTGVKPGSERGLTPV